MLAHWLVRQKLNHVSSIEFSYVALHAPLVANQLSLYGQKSSAIWEISKIIRNKEKIAK